ncbi:MAG: tautomerase family protein, partial [Geminicoccaceae bacterium]
LTTHREVISEAIHSSICDVLGLPAEKRFHRFIALDKDDLIYPSGRGSAYTVIEILMFEGRDRQTCRRLLERLMTDVSNALECDIEAIEITLIETPQSNWGIRGKVADELVLNYSVNR